MAYTFDAVFVKEFDMMVRELTAVRTADIVSIPTPDSFSLSKMDTSFEQVTIKGIEIEYYSKLNGTVAYLLSRPKLVRKKFNSNGDYVKDKDGNYFTEDVVVHKDCIAILSKVKIGVPNKFKTEGYEYVDLYVADNGKTKELYYIYIIPRSVAYKLNLCALCLSLDRPKKIYGGCQVYLYSGHKVYLYIAPYKISSVTRNYRVFTVKPSIDLTKEYKELLTFWGENGIIFNIEYLWLSEVIGDRDNAGYTILNNTLDEYVCYDENVSMANDINTIEELDIITSSE